MRLERGLGKREHYSPAFVSDDDGFWNESDGDYDFGGSDTGEDENQDMEDFEEEGEEGSDDEEA